MTSAERKRILKRAKRKARDKRYQPGRWAGSPWKVQAPAGAPLTDDAVISL